MKVYINRAPVTTPHGGGNKSLALIVEKIIEAGHELVFDLSENIDVIFCFDPRPNSARVWYQDFINYKSKNPRCKIIQRVGDVGTHSKPELNHLLKQIVEVNTTDYFIFPSEWARKMINHTDQNFSVIPNRPLTKFYQNREEYSSLNSEEINIVTHHWSDNDKKGFSTYQQLGEMISSGINFEGRSLKFTYIGRYSNKYSSEGISVLPPVGEDEIVRTLPRYDLYLTASEEEAGANHVLEAMACGLPIIFKANGGSIQEYCADFGNEYSNFEELLALIEKTVTNIEEEKKRVLKYREVAETSINEYLRIIESFS